MKERAFFIGGLVFAMLGVVAIAVSVFGWVTVGFFVQDNTESANLGRSERIDQSAAEREFWNNVVLELRGIKHELRK